MWVGVYIICRDHIVLSEAEATVERIRQHKEEEESDEDEMQEWENKRRTAAFARYVLKDNGVRPLYVSRL